MALVVKDRVKETSATTGTGTLTLAGATTGFQSFATIGNGNTTYYTIYDPVTGAWEVGIGTYTASGTTLSRDTVLASSNAGALVNLGAGDKSVWCDYPAGKAVYYDATGTLTIPSNLSFSTVGSRITGDFSNATVSNRLSFQTSTANSSTFVGALPNGTSVTSGFAARNDSNPTNSGSIIMQINTTEAAVYSSRSGTGTYLPLSFYTSGLQQLQIDTSGTAYFTNTAYITGNRVAGITATNVSTASGTTAGTNGIPADVKRIQVVFQNFSVTSTVVPYIQLGTAAGFVATGYTGSVWYHSTSGVNAAATVATGMELVNTIAAATLSHGCFSIYNVAGTNRWVFDGHIEGNAGLGGGGAGTVTLPGTLDRVQITGATFDGGSITITYE